MAKKVVAKTKFDKKDKTRQTTKWKYKNKIAAAALFLNKSIFLVQIHSRYFGIPNAGIIHLLIFYPIYKQKSIKIHPCKDVLVELYLK